VRICSAAFWLFFVCANPEVKVFGPPASSWEFSSTEMIAEYTRRTSGITADICPRFPARELCGPLWTIVGPRGGPALMVLRTWWKRETSYLLEPIPPHWPFISLKKFLGECPQTGQLVPMAGKTGSSREDKRWLQPTSDPRPIFQRRPPFPAPPHKVCTHPLVSHGFQLHPWANQFLHPGRVAVAP